MNRILFAVFMWFSFIAYVQSAPQTFSNNDSSVSILELYTSEGCSSCPPAERWFNRLKQDSRLWKEFIPVAFHVDYWNYIGWSDRFSSSIFSKRQKTHSQQGHISAVYTPGFILDGKEWQGWRIDRPLSFDKKENNSLFVQIENEQLRVDFKTTGNKLQAYVNVAVLGFDLETEVKSGENKGKILKHDFVVIGYDRVVLLKTKGGYTLTTKMPSLSEESNKKGIAVWVEYENEITPVQAAGGWLMQ